MDQSVDPGRLFDVSGFHTQLYNDIVHPQRVWRVSKYFLRRWSPYLGPTRFWTIVAARQMAYRNRQSDRFEGYDAAVAQEAKLSRAHYRRIKAEMGEQESPLSLFITKEATRYHVVNGKTRPKPTQYHVRLDDPLTPADAAYLAHYLQSLGIKRRAPELVDALQAAQQAPRQELFAPHLAPYLAQKPAVYRPTTVLDVIEQVFGAHIASQPDVKRQAEALHTYMTDVDFVGKQYFRHQWLPQLKPGAAFLMVYLRSLCFFNEETGELRNRIDVNRQALAEMFGVKANTITDWLKTLSTAAPDQALPPFIQLIEKGRTSDNSYRFKYEVCMLDPLTHTDLLTYEERLSDPESEFEPYEKVEMNGSQSDFERHDRPQLTPPQSENAPHTNPILNRSLSENEPHGRGRSENVPAQTENEPVWPNAESEIEREVPEVDPVLSRPQQDYVNLSARRSVSFQYYPTLLNIETEEINTLLTADGAWGDWKCDEKALAPLAEAVCDDWDQFFDWLQVDPGGPSREKMQRGGLSMNEMAAWWLYAQQQDRLREPVRLVVARSMAGVKPPAPYREMADLSWETWHSFAITQELPYDLRPDWSADPKYGRWLKLYGDTHPAELPFGVGDQVPMAAEWLIDYYAEREKAGEMNPAESAEALWEAICGVLKQQIDLSLYDIFLAKSRAIEWMGESLVVEMPDKTAESYVKTALFSDIQRSAHKILGRGVDICWVIPQDTGTPLLTEIETGISELRLSEAAALWHDVKRELSHQLPKQTYDLWVRSAEVVAIQERCLIIALRNDYAKQWLVGRYQGQIERLLRLMNNGQPLQVEFIVEKQT